MLSLAPRCAQFLLLLATPLAIVAASQIAYADEPAPGPLPVVDEGPPLADQVGTEEERDAKFRVDRTWLYGDDAHIPLPLTAIATASLSYTNVGNSPTRVSSGTESATCVNSSGNETPCYLSMAANTAQPGAMMLIGGEVGLLPRLSVQGNVMVGLGGSDIPSPNVGGTASLRVQVLPDSWRHLHLVVSGGYIREAWGGPVFNDDKWLPGNPNGDNGAFFQVAMSGDVSRLRLGGTMHGEHIFADGRDPLDVMIDLGASYRVAGSLRAGIEYVGQDREETFAAGSEAGTRHIVGPVASMQFFHDRLTLVGGPAVGLSPNASAHLMARVGASFGF
jgi:hypothetical protein